MYEQWLFAVCLLNLGQVTLVNSVRILRLDLSEQIFPTIQWWLTGQWLFIVFCVGIMVSMWGIGTGGCRAPLWWEPGIAPCHSQSVPNGSIWLQFPHCRAQLSPAARVVIYGKTCLRKDKNATWAKVWGKKKHRPSLWIQKKEKKRCSRHWGEYPRYSHGELYIGAVHEGLYAVEGAFTGEGESRGGKSAKSDCGDWSQDPFPSPFTAWWRGVLRNQERRSEIEPGKMEWGVSGRSFNLALLPLSKPTLTAIKLWYFLSSRVCFAYDRDWKVFSLSLHPQVSPFYFLLLYHWGENTMEQTQIGQLGLYLYTGWSQRHSSQSLFYFIWLHFCPCFPGTNVCGDTKFCICATMGTWEGGIIFLGGIIRSLQDEMFKISLEIFRRCLDMLEKGLVW